MLENFFKKYFKKNFFTPKKLRIFAPDH